jgi:hypothetical protein
MNLFQTRVSWVAAMSDPRRANPRTWFRQSPEPHRPAESRRAGSAAIGGTVRALIAAMLLLAVSTAVAIGPDVVCQDIQSVARTGPTNGILGYSLGGAACNVGDVPLRYGDTFPGSPVFAQNVYRLHEGTFVQVGMSWGMQGCCPLSLLGCGGTCVPAGSSRLGVRCMNVWTATSAGTPTMLVRRSSVRPFNGLLFSSPPPQAPGLLAGRVQVAQGDMDSSLFPGAIYFAEGVFVGSDDAESRNATNNASWRRVTVAASRDLTPAGVTAVGEPAIYAWRANGLGVGVPDPSVRIVQVNIPNEGRLFVASKASPVSGALWRYQYAVFNLNSDVAVAGFDVPAPAGVAITDRTFRDVIYHSGEVYSNTDWASTRMAERVAWSCTETFGENPNANALRWGTMYTFGFTANTPPRDGASGTLTLFKPHTPQSFGVALAATPSAPACIADLDDGTGTGTPDGGVTIDDLLFYLGIYSDGVPRADVDDGSSTGTPDGGVTIDDLLYYLLRFEAGC